MVKSYSRWHKLSEKVKELDLVLMKKNKIFEVKEVIKEEKAND